MMLSTPADIEKNPYGGGGKLSLCQLSDYKGQVCGILAAFLVHWVHLLNTELCRVYITEYNH